MAKRRKLRSAADPALDPDLPTELELQVEAELRLAYEAEQLGEEAQEAALKEPASDRGVKISAAEDLEKVLESFTKEKLVALLRRAITRYADFGEIVSEAADEYTEERKIFVHGLGRDATEEMVVNLFGKFGEVEDVKVVMDRVTGTAKGYAFVTFKGWSGAWRALEQPQMRIGGRLVTWQLASKRPAVEAELPQHQLPDLSGRETQLQFGQTASVVNGGSDIVVANQQAFSPLISRQGAGLEHRSSPSGFGGAQRSPPGLHLLSNVGVGYGNPRVARCGNLQAVQDRYLNPHLRQNGGRGPPYENPQVVRGGYSNHQMGGSSNHHLGGYSNHHMDGYSKHHLGGSSNHHLGQSGRSRHPYGINMNGGAYMRH